MEIIEYQYKEINNQEIIDSIGAKAKKAGISIEFDTYFDQVYGQIDTKDILKLSSMLKNDKDLRKVLQNAICLGEIYRDDPEFFLNHYSI